MSVKRSRGAQVSAEVRKEFATNYGAFQVIELHYFPLPFDYAHGKPTPYSPSQS